MPSGAPDRRLATVLFLDIVGSTATASEIGDRRWHAILARFRKVVRTELKRFGGKEQDTAGDGFFATFAEPANAIRCAVAISSAVQDIGIDIRIGLHTGEIVSVEGALSGIAVHIGARVMALGGAAEILVTGTVKDLVAGSKIGFEDRSIHTLKGVEGTWHVFAVTEVDGARLPSPLAPVVAAARVSAVEAEPMLRRRARALIAAGAIGTAVAIVAVLALTQRAGSGAETSSSRGPVTLIKIDPSTRKIVTTLRDGAYSEHLWSVLGIVSGTLWQGTPDGLVQRDVATGEIQNTIPLDQGLGPADLGAGSVFVASPYVPGVSEITRYDAVSGTELDQLRVNGDAADLRYSNGAVWFLAKDGTLTKIDPLKFKVIATYDTKTFAPGVVVPLAGYVWICDCEVGKVIQFDPRTETVVRTLTLAQHGLLFGVDSVDGPTVWLLDPGASTLTPIDPETGATGRPIGVPAQISDATISGGSIWISSPAEIRRIPLDSSQSDPPIVMPADVSAGSIAVDPETGDIWVANCGCPKS
jgi:class 3 adenylate cyclase/streptogramin lyase